ncbi:MAG TPA: hypothetical protein VF841_00305 [Anaeromyxobacter sp.]
MASASGCVLPAGSPALVPGPGAKASTLTCRLVPKGGGRSTLHLSGSLHPAWAGRLAAGLAARQVSVVRAAARRGSTRWTAEIEIEVPEGIVEPSAIDFVALMKEPRAPEAGGPVALASWRVQPTRTDVEVELRAGDAVGFLGRALLVFAELGLFPRAMRVETVGGAVRDLFLLQGAGGERPPDGVVSLLRRRLAGLVPED